MSEVGPIYNVPLIDSLPIGTGMMKQAMPSRQDLLQVQQLSERTVAGYEVLLSHYSETIRREESKQNILEKVFGFATKMSRSGCADRARAGNDMLELLDQMEFIEPST